MLDISRLFGFGLLFSLLPVWAFAQLAKGDQTFVQDGNIVFLNSEGQFAFSGSYQGEQAKLFTDHIMLGSAAGGGLTVLDGDNIYLLIASPFARFYFNPENERIAFFAALQGSVMTSFFGDNGNTSFSLFPHVGGNYFVQPDVSIRARTGVTFTFDDLLPNPFTIQFDMEPFFKGESWESRKSATNTLQTGAFTIQDAQFNLGFIGGGTQIALGSEVGYMAAERLLVGSGLLVQSISDVSSSVTISPFLRYYLTQNHTSWYLQGQADLAFTTFRFFNGMNETFNQNLFFAGGGFNKFLNDHIALDARLGFSVLTMQDADVSVSGLTGELGMQYHFGGGQ